MGTFIGDYYFYNPTVELMNKKHGNTIKVRDELLMKGKRPFFAGVNLEDCEYILSFSPFFEEVIRGWFMPIMINLRPGVGAFFLEENLVSGDVGIKLTRNSNTASVYVLGKWFDAPLPTQYLFYKGLVKTIGFDRVVDEVFIELGGRYMLDMSVEDYVFCYGFTEYVGKKVMVVRCLTPGVGFFDFNNQYFRAVLPSDCKEGYRGVEDWSKIHRGTKYQGNLVELASLVESYTKKVLGYCEKNDVKIGSMLMLKNKNGRFEVCTTFGTDIDIVRSKKTCFRDSYISGTKVSTIAETKDFIESVKRVIDGLPVIHSIKWSKDVYKKSPEFYITNSDEEGAFDLWLK